MNDGSEQMGLVKVDQSELLPAITTPAITAPAQDVALTAENADEMVQCQNAIIVWCKAKVAELRQQTEELTQAFQHAVKRKWKSDTLKRHAAIAAKRQSFYERMLVALEHGYQIVPSFPVTAFAVRTDRKKPLRMMTTMAHRQHEQEAESLPAGEGEYKNPFPMVYQRTIQAATQTTHAIIQYFAEAWRDLEFPISMAKPRIIEAVERAMALKIFDDFGILPADSRPKGDPLIIARLKDPRQSGYSNPRYVCFIVAWHLNTADL